MASTVFVNSVTLTAASWFQDVDNVAYQYLSGVAGTNTITATGPAGLGAYAAGLKFRFIPAATNTGATTINITGTAALGARNIFSGGIALSGGELRAGIPVEITDDGTQFSITSLAIAYGTWTPAITNGTSYLAQLGRYIKIGKLVQVSFHLALSGRTSDATAQFITGLPFTSASSTTSQVTCAVFWSALTTATTNIVATVVSSSTTATLSLATVAAVSIPNMIGSDLSNTSILKGSFVYEAAS